MSGPRTLLVLAASALIPGCRPGTSDGSTDDVAAVRVQLDSVWGRLERAMMKASACKA